MTDTTKTFDPFGARDTFETGTGPAGIYRLAKLEQLGLGQVSRLPYSIRVLLEAVLRTCDGYEVTEEDVKNLAAWQADAVAEIEIPFKPARVVLQDFTGVPAVVDLAAMRSAMRRLGGDPKKINPLIPVDLVIDHSVQVDFFGSDNALQANVELEFERNRERYEFLRWGQRSFQNFRAVPPNVGIVHQVNLEFLAKAVFLGRDGQGAVAFPDTLVGTDSHTTMINGLGVVGWGVGGIEAEAVMLGQPLYMLMPEVVGMELTGQLSPGATATDLVLTVTEILRKAGRRGKIRRVLRSGRLVDVAGGSSDDRQHGAGIRGDDGLLPGRRRDAELPAADRTHGAGSASWSNATRRNRGCSAPTTRRRRSTPRHSTLDLSTVEPCVAGPKRPQDRVPLTQRQVVVRGGLAGAAESTRIRAQRRSARPHRPRWWTTAAPPKSATAPW